jgi:hypothetical protein
MYNNLGVIQMDDDINFRLKNIEKNVEKILEILNGRDGVITTLVLHEEKIKEIPPPRVLKFWAAAGGGIVSGLGLITWMVFQALKSTFTGS